MLVLTRKPGQSILIGDNIKIVFQGYNGNSAVIGIEAPKSVAILREEIKGKTFTPKEKSDDTKKPYARATSKTPEPAAGSKKNDALTSAVTTLTAEIAGS